MHVDTDPDCQIGWRTKSFGKREAEETVTVQVKNHSDGPCSFFTCFFWSVSLMERQSRIYYTLHTYITHASNVFFKTNLLFPFWLDA